jgi:hypothetical protein
MARKIEMVVIGTEEGYGVMYYVPKDKVWQMMKVFDNFLEADRYLTSIESSRQLKIKNRKNSKR